MRGDHPTPTLRSEDELPTALASERIRERIVGADRRFHANDNISEFILEGELEELKAFIGTKSQDWEGPAREAYRVAQGEWDKSFVHMQTTLHLSSSAVQQIGENYQTAEQKNASIWG